MPFRPPRLALQTLVAYAILLPCAHSQAPHSTTAQVHRCLAQAAAAHRVPLPLLRGVAEQESGLRPHVTQRNKDGSVDYGLMQVNSLWLPVLAAHGISAEDLMQPCVNADVGAWILSQALRREGDTWRAVGSYHSRTPRFNQAYAWAIYRRLEREASRAAPRHPSPTAANAGKRGAG